MEMYFPPVVQKDSPTPAYDPYENRSTTRQVNRQQIKPLFFYSYLTIKRNVMRFSFIHPFKLNLGNEHTHIPEVTIHQPLHDTSEGSEFLDDALRMEDLSITPYAYTEQSVAAGSPANLL
jgi:hypothetical protein